MISCTGWGAARLWKNLVGTLAMIVIVLVALNVLRILTGSYYPVTAVLSGSMEPTFYRGDLLFLTLSKDYEFRVGDIIVYELEGRDYPIVHRIVELLQEPGKDVKLLTKGDNNAHDDRVLYGSNRLWLERHNVVGVVKVGVPAFAVDWHTLFGVQKIKILVTGRTMSVPFFKIWDPMPSFIFCKKIQSAVQVWRDHTMLAMLDSIALNRLCRYLAFNDIIHLVLTGDGMMQQKLMQRHVVTHVSVTMPPTTSDMNKLLAKISVGIANFATILSISIAIKRSCRTSATNGPTCETMANFAHSLPRMLKSLVIDIRYTVVDFAFFESLPPNLLRLELLGNICDISKCLSHFPPTLTWLKIRGRSDMTSKHLAQLPKNLQHLNLLSLEKYADQDVSLFSRDLKSLVLKNMRTLTDAAVPFLPPSLTFLDLRFASQLTDACVPLLPRTLKRLLTKDVYTGSYFTEACLEHLPPHLEQLGIIIKFTNQLNQYRIKDLPSSLSELKLGLVHCDVNCVIPNLPRRLYTLILSGGTTCPLTCSAVGALPPLLKNLQFYNAFGLTNELVACLPRQLERLNIFRGSLTDACVPHLPSSLKSLGLPYGDISWNVGGHLLYLDLLEFELIPPFEF